MNTNTSKPHVSSLSEMKRNKDMLFKAITNGLQSERAFIGQHTWKILKQSLSMAGVSKLYGTTLLDKPVRNKHKERMISRFEKLTAKIISQANDLSLNPDAILRSRLRFITVIHSVESFKFIDDEYKDCSRRKYDVSQSIKAIKDMKALITTCINEFPGVRCIGAAEVEVVNIAMMGKLNESLDSLPIDKSATRPESSRRKLNVLNEIMPLDCKGQETLALIHFHGVIDLGPNHPDVIKILLSERMKSEETWAKAGHQIQMKSLTELRGGKRKSVSKSLEHIARYITKGGNMLYQDDNYLRYKLSFDQDDLDAEIEMTAMGHRSSLQSNEMIKRESKEDGIENPLAMTSLEVVYLAEVINKMMSINRTRDGYVLSV
jgi:hypothetical protein